MSTSQRRRSVWKGGSRPRRTACAGGAALGVVLHPFDLEEDGPAVAAITTRLRRCHATDSTYIDLAQQLDTDLWTLDGPLARSAADLGLPVELIT